MCCFSKPVLSVNNTQIFARLNQGKQFLAYQMNYESEIDNAMILPIPVTQPATDADLRFIDLQGYDNFFADLDNGFPHRNRRFSLGCGSTAVASKSMIEVFKVGNYIASFVPSLNSFERLDPRFRLPDSTWEKIPAYQEFGFAVFQLAAGALKPHPMAFEFSTLSNSLFFPTIHIHDGEVHEREHFDHLLYMQHEGFDIQASSYRNSDVVDRTTGVIRSSDRAGEFADVAKSQGLLDGELLVHRKIMRGTLPNEDTIVSLDPFPVDITARVWAWRKVAPWLVGVAAIGWFFNRRSKVKQSLESGQKS